MAKRTNVTSQTRIAARERQAHALELRKRGMTFQQISQALGYGSPASAFKAVRNALDEVVHESARDLLTLEGIRLNTMLTKLWPEVERGNLHAVDRVLRILHLEAKLFRLYSMPVASASVVIPGGSAQEPARISSLDAVDPLIRDRFYQALRDLQDALHPPSSPSPEPVA